MDEGTRRAIHFGVNYLISPEASLDTRSVLRFEEALAERSVPFESREKGARGVSLGSSDGIQVRIARQGPQVSQLLIVAPNPTTHLELFIKRAEALCASYLDIWKNAQALVHRDATIRHLYQAAGDHAFKFLWEERLGQQEHGLAVLKRPVLGGGLRLVMPPTEAGDPQVEVRIESYLRDPRMLFVEIQSTWATPIPLSGSLNPGELLHAVQRFGTEEVVAFIRGSTAEGKGHE